jgi:hypothetical protein
MPDISDPKSAFTGGHGGSGIDTHDESYAGQRPDSVGRSQVGGNGEGEYIKVNNDDHLHFDHMLTTSIDPLRVRLRAAIDGIPEVECGTFPHGQALTTRVRDFKADYLRKCDEVDTAADALRAINRTVGQRYGTTEDDNAATAADVRQPLAAANQAVASMGRPGMPGEPDVPPSAGGSSAG